MKLLVSAVFIVTVFIDVNSWNNFGIPSYPIFTIEPFGVAQQRKIASWRNDMQCNNGGNNILAPNGRPAECNPSGPSHCCSEWGHCGSSAHHCQCRNCIDYSIRVSVQRKCHGGVVIAGQCLFFSKETVSWRDAKSRCLSKKLNIASLVDPKAFTDYAKNYHAGVILWLGATDFLHEGHWVWNDGRELGPQFPWIRGEPNNHDGNQHCLNWGGITDVNGFKTFDDGICSAEFKYVCSY